MSAARLVSGLSYHAFRLATFRGSVQAIPDSTGLTTLVMMLSLVGGLAEQIARGHGIGMLLVIPFVWLPFVFLHAWNRGKLDRRLAAGLFLTSIPIEMAMVLTRWVPALEWPVAAWSGAVLVAVVASKDR